MTRYANQTSVPLEKSRGEIEMILSRYGASQFAYASDSDKGTAAIQFCAKKRHIRFILHLPSRNHDQFKYTEARKKL